MSRTIVRIGPNDNGRRMSLDEFDHAEGMEGHVYELGKGVIAVVDVPDRKHLVQLLAIRRQFNKYDVLYPNRINTIAGGGECKILLPGENSERHPDLAIYLSSPSPGEENLWANWVPEIAVEIVSRGSRHRDYVEKREEYLTFGVGEYWIVDAEKEEMLMLRRAGRKWSERTLSAGTIYRTALLPDFELDTASVFDAARAVG